MFCTKNTKGTRNEVVDVKAKLVTTECVCLHLPMGLTLLYLITLPAFHRLLKQPHQTNGLEDTEFCASAKQLKTKTTQQFGRNKIPKISKI
jgi:hypothetical protein